MKTILYTLVLTFSNYLFASAPIFPQLYNFGTSIQLQVHNTTTDNVICQGNVSMHTMLGSYETHFYYDLILSGAISFRTFYITNFNDRVNFAYHTINCFRQ